MNEIFLIRANGFNEIKQQMIIKSIPTLLISMGFGVGIVFFNAEDKESLISILPFMIPILILSSAYGVFRGVKRQKMLFQSYKLTISENNIVREQANTSKVDILLTEIQSIIKDKKGGYTIKGKTAVETILVPAQIENHENLELLFNQIKPVEELTQPSFDEKYRIPILLLMLICMATVYISFNKILVGVCCLIVSSLLIRSSIQILNNKNIDHKTKRVGYYSLVVLASVVAVTIMKFNL